MISDGNRLFGVTGAKKIVWGLFLTNLRFCVNEKTQINILMEARFKVFLTIQVTLSKFEKKRLSSCYKKILQLLLVAVKL